MGTFTNKKPDFTEPFRVRCVCGYELIIYPDMKRGGGYFTLCPWCPWQAEDLSVAEYIAHPEWSKVLEQIQAYIRDGTPPLPSEPLPPEGLWQEQFRRRQERLKAFAATMPEKEFKELYVKCIVQQWRKMHGKRDHR